MFVPNAFTFCFNFPFRLSAKKMMLLCQVSSNFDHFTVCA